jgi:CubicO group peptidase (beta-lactamase class C family)
MHPAHSHLQRLADDAAATHHCPTVAWGLVADGGLVDGVDTDVVYRIASMTKSFTCAAVLALRDDGALSLDVPVAHYAPELASVVGPPGSPAITLRLLMSMQSGLATDDAWADRHLDITPEEIDRIYAAGPTFAMMPGTGFEYSNLGFGIIGRVVWRATGTRVQEHITRRFLGPLGMNDSTWVQPHHERWAKPFRVEDGRIVPDGLHPIGDGEIAPMGGIWTTVADLARWVSWLDAANHSDAAADGWVGLSPASRREMQQMHTYSGNSTVAGRTGAAGYGFGTRIFDDPTIGITVAHSGGVPGYGTNMRWLPGTGIGVIALANVTYAPMNELTLRMLVALHDDGHVPPNFGPATALLAEMGGRLVDLLNRWDDDVAAALFADNVHPDESFARRAAAAERLVALHGQLRLVGMTPTRRTSGTLHVQGSGAAFTISVELGPMAEHLVQKYEITVPA